MSKVNGVQTGGLAARSVGHASPEYVIEHSSDKGGKEDCHKDHPDTA